jgi:hypothetical protein
MLRSMGVKHVEAYGDSLLVVQQVAGEFQCLEGSLRACLDACLGIISSFAEFQIHHVSRHENQKANMLAQQASGYDVGGRNFHIQEQPIHEDLYFCRVSAEKSAKPTALVGLAYLDSLASQSAWPTLPVGLADSPMANLANVHNKLSNRPSKTSSDVGADLHDWRTGLPYWHIYEIQVPKLIKVFDEVLSSMIGLAKLLVMLEPIYMIGGLPYWHIYEIQVPKLIKVFDEVLSSIVYAWETLKIAPSQHTSEGLGRPRGLTRPAMQQETKRNRRNRSRDR